jgi:hypothetical protein
MSRHDARTVSYTVITLTESSLRMAYTADSPDQPVQPQTLSIPVAVEAHWK